MRPLIPAVALGMALGGFFDGILLHQILQWHHLFSLVPGMTDLRRLILWDGYFHAGMYGLAVIGLAGIWRRRGVIGDDPHRRLWAPMLMGFGLWHAIDAVLSHWVLGIHRIKDDSAVPLLWDAGWLIVFGILPAAARLWLGMGGGGPRRSVAGVTGLLAALSAGMGLWAMQPPPGQPMTAVVFRQALPEPRLRAVVEDAGGRVLWLDADQAVAVVDLPRGAGWGLYRHGAMLVAGTGLAAGCFAWSRA